VDRPVRLSRPVHGRRVASLAAILGVVALVSASCVSVTSVGQEGGEGGPSASAAPTAVVPPARTFVPLAPTATPLATPEPLDTEVFGFLPYWSLEGSADAIDTDLVDTVAWFGVEANGDGRLVREKPDGGVPPGWEGFQSDAWRDLQARLQADGVEVVLVVQRFGWSDGTAERTERLLEDRDSHDRLAKQITDLVTDRQLDGVNLDVEPIPERLAEDYVALVRTVRAALDEVDPELSLTLEVHPSLDGYDLAALTADDAADRAIIMGYEYRGDGAEATGSQAPLADESGTDLRTTIEEALGQVSGDRLLVALPWYGRAWSADSPEPGAATVSGEDIEGPTTVNYDAAVAQAIESGREYVPGQESALSVYVNQDCTDCPATWRQLWYDDHDGFGAKLDHAIASGLAGVGIWALGFEGDRPELWSALRQRILRTVDEQAPNGSASLEPSAGVGERSDLTVVDGSAPILTFASDEPDGSGLAFVRVSLQPDIADDGTLAVGRTFPASRVVSVPLGDPAIGGTDEPGQRDIHVQWRDVAGNWSAPLVISVWADDPDGGVSLPS
jgi:spore germination protein YaaH